MIIWKGRFVNGLITAILLSVLCFGSFFASKVQAQQAGISISPALIEETLDPGFSKQYNFTLRNLESSERTFYLSTRNIADVRPGGVPVFAQNDEETGMELADWIDLPVTEVTLEGGGSQKLSFNMNVPENASPGSHFGGVFVSVDPPELERSGAAVGYQVANIISIRVSGDVNETASIRQFSTDKFLYGSQNVEFSIRIENSGNVLVRPSGPLEIKNMLGQTVDTLIFNETQSSVFPGRTRDFNITWEGNSLGFGRYEAILSPVYGDQGAKKTISSTVTFWILPMSVIGPALGILGTILFVTFIGVRIYIHRTIAQMSPARTRMIHRRRKKRPSATLLVLLIMLTVTALFLIVLLALFA